MFRFIATVTCLLACVPALGNSFAGALDLSFGNGGKVTNDFGLSYSIIQALAVQPDNKIIAAGDAGGHFAIARYEEHGQLDTSFGHQGLRVVDLGGLESFRGVDVQADGSIVATGSTNGSGSYDVVLTRLTPSGDLDPTFGSNGIVITDVGGLDIAQAVAVQADGKIVVGGWQITSPDLNTQTADYILLRYETNGALDPTFGNSGIVVTDFFGGEDRAFDIALDSHGNILAVGTADGGHSRDFAVARYDQYGELDPTFGTDGKVITDLYRSDRASAVALQADGRIVVGGDVNSSSYTDMGLVRYLANGTLDMSFGVGGKVTTDIADRDFLRALIIDDNQRIVAGGFSEMSPIGSPYTRSFALVRYAADGTIDPSFGAGGIVETDFLDNRSAVIALAQQDSGKIIAGGFATLERHERFALARYLTVPEPSSLRIVLSFWTLFALVRFRRAEVTSGNWFRRRNAVLESLTAHSAAV